MKQQLFNGKSLSQIASELSREMTKADFASQEASWYGCPEVGSMINGHMEAAIDRILAAAGLSREEWDKLVAERTNYRWAYFNRMLVAR